MRPLFSCTIPTFRFETTFRSVLSSAAWHSSFPNIAILKAAFDEKLSPRNLFSYDVVIILIHWGSLRESRYRRYRRYRLISDAFGSSHLSMLQARSLRHTVVYYSEVSLYAFSDHFQNVRHTSTNTTLPREPKSGRSRASSTMVRPRNNPGGQRIEPARNVSLLRGSKYMQFAALAWLPLAMALHISRLYIMQV